jgi:hypothetical protein
MVDHDELAGVDVAEVSAVGACIANRPAATGGTPFFGEFRVWEPSSFPAQASVDSIVG